MRFDPLPYLMENEEENSEAVFNRYFANALALKILDENPLVETYYKEWKVKGELKSQLSVNETLKNVDLRETPWLLDALSEEENMERIAGFFDRSRVESELLSAATKLERMQMPIGGFRGTRWPRKLLYEPVYSRRGLKAEGIRNRGFLIIYAI